MSWAAADLTGTNLGLALTKAQQMFHPSLHENPSTCPTALCRRFSLREKISENGKFSQLLRVSLAIAQNRTALLEKSGNLHQARRMVKDANRPAVLCEFSGRSAPDSCVQTTFVQPPTTRRRVCLPGSSPQNTADSTCVCVCDCGRRQRRRRNPVQSRRHSSC